MFLSQVLIERKLYFQIIIVCVKMGVESTSSSSSVFVNGKKIKGGETQMIERCGDRTKNFLAQTRAHTHAQVVLNVYDLTSVNKYTFWFGLGIFHSGIEVRGKEYAFGAHDYPSSGVFEVEPKTCPGFIFRCSIKLGHIDMLPSQFRSFIGGVASEYHGDAYHLISRNCNHFTDDISFRLTGKRIPGWVNRLARIGTLCSCLLPERLQVTTVRQLPEYHECSPEDGRGSMSTRTTQESRDMIKDSIDQDRCLLSPLGGRADVAFVGEYQVKVFPFTSK